MHDLFDIVGLPRSARPVEVRRVCARLVRRTHPDFVYPNESGHAVTTAFLPSSFDVPAVRRDTAVDFLEMNAVLDRVQSAFFRDPAAGTF